MFSSKFIFVGLNRLSLYLLGRQSIVYEGIVACLTSVMVNNLHEQFWLNLLEYILICFSLLFWRLSKTTFWFLFKEAWNRVNIVEWSMVLLFCLVIDGQSDIHELLPFAYVGYFQNIFIVRITRFVCEGHLSLNRE